MQIVQNWAEITGTVEDVSRSGDDVKIELLVESAEDVEGFPNLLSADVGTRITLRVSQPPVRVERGDTIRCRARRAGMDSYFGLGETLTRSD